MRKICFVITKMTDGGAERVTSLVSSALSKSPGMEIHLVTLEKRENEYELAAEVVRHNVNAIFTSAVDMIKCFIKTRWYLRKLKCDCYVGIDILANILVSSIGAFSKRKTIISERNAPKQVKIRGIMKFLRKVFYPFTDCIVFQTAGAQNDYPKHLARKGVIIPNPVKRGLPACTAEKHVICAAGRLSHEKNYYLLINAFKTVSELHPEYSLSIFGQGVMENELKEYVERIGLTDKIVFEGYCADVHEKMKTSEIFVLSSNSEGMPNSLLEAMAMGFPVISTDCPPGGPKSMINDGQNGLLVPVGDEGAMASAMLKYIEDADFRKSAGKLAAKVNEEYAVEKITAAWEECIENVLSK